MLTFSYTLKIHPNSYSSQIFAFWKYKLLYFLPIWIIIPCNLIAGPASKPQVPKLTTKSHSLPRSVSDSSDKKSLTPPAQRRRLQARTNSSSSGSSRVHFPLFDYKYIPFCAIIISVFLSLYGPSEGEVMVNSHYDYSFIVLKLNTALNWERGKLYQ